MYNVKAGGGDNSSLPFFHISQDTADRAEVMLIKDGHFSLAFVEEEGKSHDAPSSDSGSKSDSMDNLNTLLPFVVDPKIIFKTDSTLLYPDGFFGPRGSSIEDMLNSHQG